QLLKQYEGQYTFYVSPIYKGLPPQAYLAPNVTEPQDYPGEWAIPLDVLPDRPIAFIIDPPTAGDFARLTRLFPHAQFNILRAPTDPQPLQYTAFIPTSDLQAVRGVRVRLYTPDAPASATPLSELTQLAINQTWSGSNPAPPFKVRYEASL